MKEKEDKITCTSCNTIKGFILILKYFSFTTCFDYIIWKWHATPNI